MGKSIRWAAAAAALVAVSALTSGGAATAVAAASPTGNIYVIQGVPNADVTVSVDGTREASDVAAKTILGPLHLSEGRHTLTFKAADAGWSTSASVTVAGGQSSDIVVHRPASVGGDPVVTTYRNPLQPVPSGQGRVFVAHTAVVPPADITVDGSVLFSNIANGEFATADVPRGRYEVSVVPTGTDEKPLLGPMELVVPPQMLTQVFAIGQPRNGSMDVVVQQLPLATAGSPPPTTIDTGSAGLVANWEVAGTPATLDDDRGQPVPVIWLALASVTSIVGLAMLRMRKRPSRRVDGRHSAGA